MTSGGLLGRGAGGVAPVLLVAGGGAGGWDGRRGRIGGKLPWTGPGDGVASIATKSSAESSPSLGSERRTLASGAALWSAGGGADGDTGGGGLMVMMRLGKIALSAFAFGAAVFASFADSVGGTEGRRSATGGCGRATSSSGIRGAMRLRLRPPGGVSLRDRSEGRSFFSGGGGDDGAATPGFDDSGEGSLGTVGAASDSSSVETGPMRRSSLIRVPH
jgi:hypothetical protein